MGSLARGTLYFMSVQLVFLASGYIIHASMGRLLGPAAYGIFGVVISLMTLVNVLLITGVPLAGSRFIAMSNDAIGAIKRTAVNLQVIFSLVIFALYFLLSPFIAKLLGDPTLSGYIRASAFVIPVYALNSLYGGFLNGLRMYSKQAVTLLAYSIAKVAGAVGMVLLGFAIYGAIIGYLLGPLIGMGIGWYYLRGIRTDSNPENFPARKIIDFAYPVIIFSFALLFLMSIDLFLVKKILGEDVQVGYYAAASTLSKFPYYILTGLGVALFPAISKSSAVQTGKYIKESMRYLMLLLLPAVFIISGSSEALVALLYSERFASASFPLAILVFGIAAFTLFSILTTVINASGMPRVSMMIAVVLIPLAAILNWLLIPAYQLEGAAIATTITGFLGLVIASMYVLRVFGVLMELVSFLKMLLASLIVFAITLSVPVSGLLLPLWYAFLFALYLCILALVKELNKKDLETFTAILATEQKSNICVEGCSSSAADKYISAQTNNSYRVEGAGMKLKHKWLVLIPVVIFVYLIYINLLPFGGTAVYSIDVGADDLQGKAKLTGPMDGISEPNETNGTTFRSLQQGLVYFDFKSPYLKNKGEVTVKVIFKDNFPQGQRFMVGAKNNDSYAWKEVYVPFYETFRWYPFVAIDNKRIYLINESLRKELTIATNSVIDQNLTFPKKFKTVSVKSDMKWIKDNVDYVILEYNFPEGNEWKAGKASWNLDELYIKDNTLSFSFNVPHLGKKEFRNYTIPVDRIEIEVKTPPVWERFR